MRENRNNAPWPSISISAFGMSFAYSQKSKAVMSSSGGGGGGKRSRPSGPKTHIASDFSKRPKAKVGKRARKPANVTDTKFRAASVKVKAQDAIGRTGDGGGGGDASSTSDGLAASSSSTSLELQSSRGKALPLLLSTLNHHSSVVRLSSLGGLKDAVAPNRASAAAVRANLNALVPALGRSCCVDDDDEVRGAALELFAEIAARVGEGDRDGADAESPAANRSEVASRHLAPYLPLLVAYVTSALNSLDVSIRLDGARAVEALIRVMGTAEVGRPQYVQDMLPAYVRVLVDAKSKGAEDSRPTSGTVGAAAAAKSSAAKKGKKGKKGGKEKAKDSAQNAKPAAVVRSLVLLLKAAAAAAASADGANASEWEVEQAESNRQDLRPSLSQPHLVFVRGGTASNAVLAHRSGTAPNPSCSLSSLAALDHPHLGSGDAGTGSVNTSNIVMPIEVQVELFGRLRDRLVELSQAGHFVGRGRGATGDENTGLCLAQSYLEEMHALISAVRLIWRMYSRSLVAAYTPTPGKKKSAEDALPKKLRSVTSAIHSLFISMLPLMSGDGGGRGDGTKNASRYDTTNSILCSAVGELGCVLERTAPTKSQKVVSDLESTCDAPSSVWTDTVFSYVLPRLDNGREEIVDVTTLRVVGQLMFGSYLDSEPTRRKELIEKFGEAFFPSDGSVEQALCTSATGRLAAMLLVDLMLKVLPMPYHDDAASGDVIQTRSLVGSMAQVLPTYLLHWEDHFPQQSATVLAALMGIVRKYKTGSPSSVEGAVIEIFEDDENSGESPERGEDPIALLVKSLRSTIGILFEQPKKAKKNEGKVPSPPLRQQSIFECLANNEIQRIILGLFGLLQYPKDSNATALAKICARSSVNDVMKDYIMDVMHSIRRTLPMQLFLTFLINSSGLSSIKRGKKKKEGVSEDGENVRPADIFAYDIAMERLCRAIVRCGGSDLLPMLTPLLSSWLGGPKVTQSSPQLAVQVQRRAVFAVLACVSFDGNAKLDGLLKQSVIKTSTSMLCKKVEDKDDQEQFLAPFVALMMNQTSILSSTLDGLIGIVPGAAENDLQGIIRSLLHLIKLSGLASALKEQEHADQLEKLGQEIEKKVANGPLDRMGGALSTEIQIHIGRRVGGV